MSPGDSQAERSLESTAVLVERVRGGDKLAREALLERYLPALRRWAHGRLPYGARDISDTDDLVQISIMRALDRLDVFEARREGAFLAYLRRIVLNAVRDELRKWARRPRKETLEMEPVAREPSHLERAIGKEALESYEKALAALPEVHQEAVIMRIELGFSYPEIAGALGRPSANAARMTVSRALVRLAEVMDEP